MATRRQDRPRDGPELIGDDRELLDATSRGIGSFGSWKMRSRRAQSTVVSVPNRLHNEVQPALQGGSPSLSRPPAAATPGASEVSPWTASRIAALAAMATVAIVVVCGLLTLSPSVAGLGAVGWLVAYLALGLGIAIAGGGRRTWEPAALGLLIGGGLVGLAVGLGGLIGILPEPADGSGSTGMLAQVFLVPFMVFMLGAPVLLFGAVLGSAIADLRVERRHRAVARGTIGWQQPTPGLENRTQGSAPLDDLGVAKATSDGTATTVVREYPMDADPEALLAADTARLATIGYALEAVERHPGKKGLAWGFMTIAAAVIDLFTVNELSDLVVAARRGRIVATYRLRSMTHAPLGNETC